MIVLIIAYYFQKRNIILITFLSEAILRKKVFISKVFRMSAVMFFLNISNICYSIFISRKAGAAGIGMFHLVMSVYTLGVTVSVSGIGLTATRLISDMPSSLALKCADSVVIKCMRVCLVPASVACMTLFFASDIIAEKLLLNPECGICLKIMAPSLLFTAVSAVINGYFTAFGRIGSISFGRLLSDASVWGCALFFLERYPGERIYMAVVIAYCTGVAVECACSFFLWKRSQTKLYCRDGADYRSILNLCTPLAVGSYLRTGLASAENLLIPAMLTLFGVSDSVASYGIIKGMTLPILMFPTVFTGAFTSLIVPEIARRRSLGYKNGIRYISSLSIEYILKFAFFISAIFFKWHKEIANMFFTESDTGRYLGYLALFPVFMFLDSAVDAILKGMDEQVTSLKINIADSVCRVICTVILIPRFGMPAYICIMYLSEFINLCFSYITLRRVSKVKFPLGKSVLVPVISLFASEVILRVVPLGNLWAQICLFAAVYIAFLSLVQVVFERR